ncbi:ribosomal protein L5 [Jaminaea rosea]|uniref:Ribosomal protein L5 n=1 Tax=Jaminaea rosea TaxID=1569628 RepID=A0A316UML7_9BASI|nr:ribosomal protein L5 [Jaminaea rosea]PWN26499.1 ribosomal protein L5 [Jaminaea rosea]
MASSSSRTALTRLASTSTSTSSSAARYASTSATKAAPPASSPPPPASPSSLVPPRNILHPSPSTSNSTASSAHSPLTHLTVGPTQLNRYEEHYRRTLAPSLLYMTHDPEWSKLTASEKLAAAPTSDSVRRWDPSNPYAKNRPARPPRGARTLQPGPVKPNFEDPTKDLVALDRVVLTAFCEDAISSKHALLPLVAQFRAITGLTPRGSWADPASGLDHKDATTTHLNKAQGHISILRAKSGVASFKIRPGMPVGVQAVLPRPVAMDFLDVLVTFVLPRMRTFQGFLLPPSSQPEGSPAAMSGVVSLGMRPEAMGYFPQTEVNWDAYSNRGIGFQIDCITNQRGPRATLRARQLLSGLGVPFVRRGDVR